jgi:solute carrier family 45 protein 1/2/4
VSEIYKSSVDQGDLDDAAFEADAVRSGARALFFQAIINIITSIGLPFLVGESGVQSSHTNGYEALNGNGNGVGGAGSHAELPSATWKRKQQDWEGLSRSRKALMWAKNVVGTIREEGLTLPIRGLTLVDVWCWSMFLFAACMLATW